eukprot:5487713-Amphidinium_carterae.1
MLSVCEWCVRAMIAPRLELPPDLRTSNMVLVMSAMSLQILMDSSASQGGTQTTLSRPRSLDEQVMHVQTSNLAYVAMVVSNIHTEHWALPISMNALVGVAAPLLWTSQNDYVAALSFDSLCHAEASTCDASAAMDKSI